MKGTNDIKSELEVGDQFDMGRNFVCTVTVKDRFGCEPHYGFTFRDGEGNYRSGWIPVEFVDRFTGHVAKQVQV